MRRIYPSLHPTIPPTLPTPPTNNSPPTDPTHRRTALTSLRTYLSHPSRQTTPLTELDLLKLWKALHYTLYMSDKPRNQQALARDLADLTSTQKSPAAQIAFLSAFWKTIAREWSAIDYLRMDKYLYLVRCMVAKGFALFNTASTASEYVDMLTAESGPLSARDAKVPAGLKLHVLDVWVDEMEKAGVEEDSVVEKLMEPVRRLVKESVVKSVRVRAKETVEDERLRDEGRRWATEEEKAEEDEDDDGEGEEGDFGGFDD